MKKQNIIIAILFVSLISAITFLVKTYKEKIEIEKKLYLHEMYSAKDTAEIIKLIILKEYTENGIDTNSKSKLDIQMFPFIKWYTNQVEKEFDNYALPIKIRFNYGTNYLDITGPENGIYFLSFELKHDSTGEIEYFIGRNKQRRLNIKRSRNWAITNYLKGHD